MDLEALRLDAEAAADVSDRAKDAYDVAVAELAALQAAAEAERVEDDDHLVYHGDSTSRIEEARRKVLFAEQALQAANDRDIQMMRRFSVAVDKATEATLARELDDSEHWHRRFHTSLAIGNGAGFLAIANHIFDKDAAPLAVAYAIPSLVIFAAGLLLGGFIPFVLARRVDDFSHGVAVGQAVAKRKRAYFLAGSSAAAFSVGVAAAVTSAAFYAFALTHPKPAPAAQTKAGSPPTSASAPAPVSRPPLPPRETPAPPARTSGPQGEASPPAADRTGGRG